MKAIFSGVQIASPAALARALRVPLQDLRTIAGAASSRYSDFQIDKKDGTKRNVSGPQLELKLLQKRINREIFENIEFPDYLNGGIKGRDYVKNASFHSHAEVVIALDIENFYTKISRIRVFEIFKNFLRQPDAVANILADLCTKDGVVPQGACTSSYLANLAFFEYEPRMVKNLLEQGLKYTRLIDDITISSGRRLSKERIEKVRVSVAGMLKVHGFKLKQRKTRITSASNPKDLMEVTGLWLNRGCPRVKREERAEIRREARKCVSIAQFDRTSTEYHELHDRVSGRVAKLTQLNHSQARIFRRDLREVLPIFDADGLRKTRSLVAGIRKVPTGSRSSIAYIHRFFQIVHRINILARTHKRLAADMRKNLRPFAPRSTKEVAIHG